MKHLFSRLPVVCLLALGSCTDDFAIKPGTEGARTELRFYDSGLLSERRFAPCLAELILFQDTEPLTVAWQIRAEGAGCVATAAVALGRAPPGFSEITRFLAMPAGTIVHASARDGSGRRGRSDPWQLR